MPSTLSAAVALIIDSQLIAIAISYYIMRISALPTKADRRGRLSHLVFWGFRLLGFTIAAESRLHSFSCSRAVSEVEIEDEESHP
jgi:hypothetical protein